NPDIYYKKGLRHLYLNNCANFGILYHETSKDDVSNLVSAIEDFIYLQSFLYEINQPQRVLNSNKIKETLEDYLKECSQKYVYDLSLANDLLSEVEMFYSDLDKIAKEVLYPEIYPKTKLLAARNLVFYAPEELLDEIDERVRSISEIYVEKDFSDDLKIRTASFLEDLKEFKSYFERFYEDGKNLRFFLIQGTSYDLVSLFNDDLYVMADFLAGFYSSTNKAINLRTNFINFLDHLKEYYSRGYLMIQRYLDITRDYQKIFRDLITFRS
ncbi:MAG: hypothetical protein QW524_03440, partial [Candidatus Woesearchaeota archaeon]